MSLQKHPRIRIPQHLAASKGQSCVRCGSQAGTTVGCHYSGLYAHRFGKGTSNKVHDVCIADLCDACHDYFDSYAAGNDDARAAEFMCYVLMTLVRRFESGQMSWHTSPHKASRVRNLPTRRAGDDVEIL